MGACAGLELKSAMHSLACILIRGDLCSHGDALPVIFIHSAFLSGLFRRRAYFTHTLCVCVGEIKHEKSRARRRRRQSEMRDSSRLVIILWSMYVCVRAAIGLVSVITLLLSLARLKTLAL